MHYNKEAEIPSLQPSVFLMLQVFYFCFSLSITETLLVHWARGIKDIDTLDVVRDDYLFGYCNVRIKHSNIKYPGRRVLERELYKSGKKTWWI